MQIFLFIFIFNLSFLIQALTLLSRTLEELIFPTLLFLSLYLFPDWQESAGGAIQYIGQLINPTCFRRCQDIAVPKILL